jgi:hypothetical protein
MRCTYDVSFMLAKKERCPISEGLWTLIGSEHRRMRVEATSDRQAFENAKREAELDYPDYQVIITHIEKDSGLGH